MTGNKQEHVCVASLTLPLYVFLCLPSHDCSYSYTEKSWKGGEDEEEEEGRKESERSGFIDEEGRGEKKS